MDDKELLDFVEQRMFNVMFEGCLTGIPYDVGGWADTLLKENNT